MRWLLALILLTCTAHAQTREVFPGQLELSVTVEDAGAVPYVGEMVLITIEGRYRRHVTREALLTPDFEGWNWMQLGADYWSNELERGKRVKVFRRRMALFPEADGTRVIPPFTHRLTLTDEGDDWFEHDLVSPPIEVEVRPRPATGGWWFPVKRLEISDSWSNPPDQLAPGEGVLRVIRVEALGASPDMLPPMPELNSPSAMIFPHPEKRLVDLSPRGPIAIGFWRWTIRPMGDVSAILEPIELDYYDTAERVARHVTISPQRVAYEEAGLPPAAVAPVAAAPAGLPGWVPAAGMVAAFALGLGAMLVRRGAGELGASVALRIAAWRGDAAGVRRAARALAKGDPARRAALARLDRALYAPAGAPPDLRAAARDVLRGAATNG